ncbi:MAG: ATP-binding protein [Pseudomonadota bacterium]
MMYVPTAERLDVKIDFKDVDTVAPFVTAFGARHGLDRRTVQHVALAIEELLANSVRHGHPDPAGKTAEIHLERLADRLLVVYIDEGVAFDPTRVAAQPVPRDIDEARVGGLGILLIRRTFDRFDYERQGARNRVYLEKRLSRAPSAI